MQSNKNYKIDISEEVFKSMEKLAKVLNKLQEENPWMFTEMYLQDALNPPKKWKVRFSFAWFDMWIGAYYDRQFKILYVCLIPCCALKIWRE